MKTPRHFLRSLVACAAAILPVLHLHAADFDVVVYGGTSAGVIAAVQAKKMGKTVVVVGPDKHLGGLSAGGLGFTDTGNKAVIGGLSRDFYHRVWPTTTSRRRGHGRRRINTATRARGLRPSMAHNARCGSSNRTWPSGSSRTT